MGEIISKGLVEILKEDISLSKKYTYEEYEDKQTVPHNSDKTIEKAYADYKKVKYGK